VPKVTEAELARRREEERLRLQREAEAAKKRQARTADEEEYGRVVLVPTPTGTTRSSRHDPWRTRLPR
jgi:hypothetical protein